MTKHVVVVGLGEIGRPLLDVLRTAYPDAVGVDVQPVTVTDGVTVMHICLPFEVEGGFIPTVAAHAHRYHPELIVIHSTVAPGTTRATEKVCGVPCVYSPVRGKHVRMRDDLRHYTKFVASIDPTHAAEAEEHFARAGLRTTALSVPESLELAKLFETTYFGLLIAWAQEMDRMAGEAGASYDELTRFFEEVSYLPRRVFVPDFIGGHCIIPNIHILKGQFQSEVLDAILASNGRKAPDGADQPGLARRRVEPRPFDET